MTERHNGARVPQPSGDASGFHHLELYVGNKRQAQHFYETALGFKAVASADLDTGATERASVMLAQGDVRVMLTGPLAPESDVADYLHRHGDSVRDVAFTVDDVPLAFERAIRAGATAIVEPHVLENEHGRMVKATLVTPAAFVHSLVEREPVRAWSPPGWKPLNASPNGHGTHLSQIDHVALCVEANTIDAWVDYYERVFGFQVSHQEDIATERSAMASKVVQNESRTVKLSIVAPAPNRGTSQIDEYLRFHGGPGAQHAALATDDIVETVRALRARGVETLATPGTYYDMLPARVGALEEDTGAFRELGILVDRDAWGYLMQIFTKPLQGRPTFFLEVIQRKGALGFGRGNIRALFEAVEREQAQRGTL